ncbi:hypothetical protein GF407_16410 [candidate division KSB1 bacterium]|nr:hypothetical protein [candidate division KSB1 bacterium]
MIKFKKACIIIFFLSILILSCGEDHLSRDDLSDCLGLATADSLAPVGGISEWFVWGIAYKQKPPVSGESLIKEIIDMHRDHHFGFIIWNAGRSTLAYRSELPNTTLLCHQDVAPWGEHNAFIREVLKTTCPLRLAINYGHEKKLAIYGRLAMNRHYGKEMHAGLTSRFASEHPHCYERGKRGKIIRHKLCYAIDEVQQERIDILLEIQRLGVDALVLDYARQMPILLYHDALVQPFIEKTGVDPHQITSTDPNDYKEWFQYRADILTGFMRKLRLAVNAQEKNLGKRCPVLVRIPDNAEWLMIAYGLDLRSWYEKDLIDGTILSPFPITKEDLELHTGFHVDMAHRHDKICMGGIGTKHLKRNRVFRNTGFYDPQPVYDLANQQYNTGVDAMTIYQSETLFHLPYLQPLLHQIDNKSRVKALCRELDKPDFPPNYPIGMDWHTKLPQLRHGLSVEEFGDNAL